MTSRLTELLVEFSSEEGGPVDRVRLVEMQGDAVPYFVAMLARDTVFGGQALRIRDAETQRVWLLCNCDEPEPAR